MSGFREKGKLKVDMDPASWARARQYLVNFTQDEKDQIDQELLLVAQQGDSKAIDTLATRMTGFSQMQFNGFMAYCEAMFPNHGLLYLFYLLHQLLMKPPPSWMIKQLVPHLQELILRIAVQGDQQQTEYMLFCIHQWNDLRDLEDLVHRPVQWQTKFSQALRDKRLEGIPASMITYLPKTAYSSLSMDLYFDVVAHQADSFNFWTKEALSEFDEALFLLKQG